MLNLIKNQIENKFLELLIKIVVKGKIIPINIDLRNFYSNSKIIYILPYASKIDLLTLRIQCINRNFPDPLEPLYINNTILKHYIFMYHKNKKLLLYDQKSQFISLFHYYINSYRVNPTLDIQFIPVSIMFGRSANYNFYDQKISTSYLLYGLKKFLQILWLGRDSYIHFSHPFSLHDIASKEGSEILTIKKLFRTLNINFFRQHWIISGTQLSAQKKIFKQILTSPMVTKVIEDEAYNKKISIKKANKHAIRYIKEISSHFSYKAIRISDKIFSWAWNKLYQGLNIYNIKRVRRLAEKGHEIVYVPCHRSHMDYLLLSYVLYQYGIAPPHIAAGINLNFWPIGLILRRLGAFFIRRSFKSNKLYSIIFREYLNSLFYFGYSVEYFIEGSRSRTGKLLSPKTGTLTMTLQSMLRGNTRPITLIPIYIGYEHILEIKTYTQELYGRNKKKEGLWNMLCGCLRLQKLGYGYINFGDPIFLSHWLSKNFPNWNNTTESVEQLRPIWLTSAVNKISYTIMMRINNAAVVNSINLCASILLSAHQYTLTRQQFIIQLSFYLQLLRNIPYASDVIVPHETPEELLMQALIMKKCIVKHDSIGDIISLPLDKAIFMMYYRNNIQHLLILPSCIIHIIYHYPGITCMQIYYYITLLYPLLKAEFFLCYEEKQLSSVIENIVTEFKKQGFIKIQEIFLYFDTTHVITLQLLSNISEVILQQYAITFSLLYNNPYIHRHTLEYLSNLISQRLSILYNMNSLEYYDKKVFSTLVITLRNESYLSNSTYHVSKKINEIYNMLNKLISPEILNTIKNTRLLIENNINYKDVKNSN